MQKSLAIALIFGLITVLILSGCVEQNQKPGPTEFPEFVEPQEPIEPTGSRCGDGVCGPAEQANPELCPTDCIPSPPTGESMVGFVGCSISNNAVQGYLDNWGENFWNPDRATESYSGGSLNAWHTQLTGDHIEAYDYWARFESMLARYPETDKIWWEMCGSGKESGMAYEDALAILNAIKERAPGLEVYATPMPEFPETYEGVCAAGFDSTTITENFINQLVQEGEVKQGPIMDVLEDYERSDGCHANEAGQAIWGQDLMDFFDLGIANKTCSELGGNACTAEENCNGKLLPASDIIRCCSISCETNQEEEVIGFVGCSATHGAIEGYFNLGGEKFWEMDREAGESYSGCSLKKWSNPRDSCWQIFENVLNQYPDTTKIWWMQCSGSFEVSYLQTVDILNEIKAKLNENGISAKIYATPMPEFPGSPSTELCMQVQNAPQITKDHIDQMVSEEELNAGPILFPLDNSQRKDGCHPNEIGQEIWGTELMEFFDSGEPNETGVPYSYFVVHIKRDPESDYFNHFYDYLKPLVESADLYNVKLTLQFSPQWIEYLLANENEKNLVKLWQKNGHEISIIHPGPAHLSWDGYSNMQAQDAINTSYIRGTGDDDIHELLGTMNDFLEMANELAYPEEIKSGTITNKWTDVPNIQYLTAGGGSRNKKAVKQTWNGNKVYTIGISGLWNSGLLENAKRDYETLNEEEIFGVVTHHNNFTKNGINAIEGWFEYLSNKDPEGIKRKTVTETFEEHILPNNLVIEGRVCGDSFCDSKERAENNCARDCDYCTFPSDCTWCTDKADCPQCADPTREHPEWGMRNCEQGNQTIFYNFVFNQ